ncbi:MAG: hypothetical protein LAP38_05340 [Acidobacteriia bacterium]|nr:hypothetical protein [Terriglobia bacterium]
MNAAPSPRLTNLSIRGDDFLLNGKPTYAGRTWNGMKVEGLLLNARAVQAIFDDLNPATRDRWAYPDTGKWDPERNTREFVAALPEWRRNGLLTFTINLQGGSPEGYSTSQPWENSALDPQGDLRPDYMARLALVLDRADQLGMAPMVGCYYFGQDQRLKDEAAVRRGVINTANWLLDRGYRNVMLEIANECDVRDYDHAILRPPRIDELIQLAKDQTRSGRRLLAGTSFSGGSVPTANVVRASDFLLLHGNGVQGPARISSMIGRTRRVDGYRPMPILINEDDHFRFDEPSNNMTAAIASHCSWGYFDPGKSDYVEGYQCPPVNWGINTSRKKAFFAKVKVVTGD